MPSILTKSTKDRAFIALYHLCELRAECADLFAEIQDHLDAAGRLTTILEQGSGGLLEEEAWACILQLAGCYHECAEAIRQGDHEPSVDRERVALAFDELAAALTLRPH